MKIFFPHTASTPTPRDETRRISAMPGKKYSAIALVALWGVGIIAAATTGANRAWRQSPSQVQSLSADGTRPEVDASRPIRNSLKPAATATQPVVASVNNAADDSLVVAPGSLAVVFGSNLSAASASAPSIPLPTALGGATVTVNGVAAPLLYASAGQIDLQIPSRHIYRRANQPGLD